MQTAKRKISYAITSPGASGHRLAEGDDPMSSSFVPLEERKELDKARFWALVGRGKMTKPKAGIF